jgi:ABC-type glycerol-3-phosphate transport system permease component
MRRVKRRLMAILRLALVGIVVLHALFPFYWAVVSSLKTGAALFEVDIIPTPAQSRQLRGDVPGAAVRDEHRQLVPGGALNGGNSPFHWHLAPPTRLAAWRFVADPLCSCSCSGFPCFRKSRCFPDCSS